MMLMPNPSDGILFEGTGREVPADDENAALYNPGSGTPIRIFVTGTAEKLKAAGDGERN